MKSGMKRDLSIMEAVLGKLLPQNNMAFGDVGVAGGRGMYFGGYGVVFLVGEDSGLHGVHEVRHVIKKKIIKRDDGSVEEEMEKPEEGEARENQKGELKERCVEFFGSYADAIGQLKDSDRITVLVDQRADHTGYAKAMSFFPKLPDVHRMVEEAKGLDLSELIMQGGHSPKKIRIKIKGMPDSIHEDEDVDVSAPLDLAFFGDKAKMGLGGGVLKVKRMPAYEASVTRGDVIAYISRSDRRESISELCPV